MSVFRGCTPTSDALPLSVLAFLVLVYVLASCSTVSGLPHPLYIDDADLAAGHQRVREMAHHYEVVHIDTSHHERHVRQRRAVQGSSYSHPPTTSFQVNAFGKTFLLQLELNTVLLPANFQLQTYNDNGDLVVDRDVVNCYYQGEIAGWSAGASHAVLSTCDGISGSFGTGPAGHWTEDRTFFIEPLTSRPTQNGTHPHAVFRVGDAILKKPNGTCGLPDNMDSSPHSHNHSLNFNSVNKYSHTQFDVDDDHRRIKRQSTTTTKYVELLLVMDNTLYTRYNRDSTVLANRARSVANYVDSVYRPLSIRVPLIAVRIFTNGNLFTVSSIADTMLTNFLAYQRTSISPPVQHDNAQLMTGLDFSGSTIGIAPVSGMCNPARSGGANQDTRTAANAVAATMAHEMGHNFGMGHDSVSRGCTCAGSNGCIMAPSATRTPPTLWSSCSLSDLNTFLGRGGASCLFNVPTTLFGSPVCGNGFVEGSEQCDCGTAAQCTDNCCNPSTCRFTSGSQCADGPCCQNCRYRATGSVCRTAVNSCDVPETCSGLTHTCPNNIFTQNGQACGSGSSASFCYDGECNVHDGQCKRTWGTTATVAPQSCYNQNSGGGPSGNCGVDSSNFYIKCTTANVRCGTLQCLGGADYTILSTSSTTRTITLGSAPNEIVCKSTRVAVGSDMADPGYVEDGTVCAANSICVNKACRTVTSLGSTPCPSSAGRVCAGNGVCTNLNSCLCNKGWTGTACERSTTGPVNGQWSTWTGFSGCSHTCGTAGVRTRTRDCSNPPPSGGGAVCPGATSSQEACNRVTCAVPVNGQWSGFGSWSTCSAACGSGGRRFRIRTCSNPPPSNGGTTCPGLFNEMGACNTQSCPSWGAWTGYSDCTKSCGRGTRMRTRTCSTLGLCVTGDASETSACSTTSCGPGPVDGAWSTWSSFGACSQTCDEGNRARTRQCNNPSATNGGKPCRTDGLVQEIDSVTCRVKGCSQWQQWGSFQPCSATCGGGDQARARVCTVPGQCDGAAIESQRCSILACDLSVDGQWAEWTAWSEVGDCYGCPAGSSRTRMRGCTDPPPVLNGEDCVGSASQNEPCLPCSPGRWGSWGLWMESGNCSLAACTEDAASNFQVRHRRCQSTLDVPCEGSFNDTQTCPACADEQAGAGGLSGGGVAGIVVALLLAAAVVVALLLFYVKRRNDAAASSSAGQQAGGAAGGKARRGSTSRATARQYHLAQDNEKPAQPNAPTRGARPPPRPTQPAPLAPSLLRPLAPKRTASTENLLSEEDWDGSSPPDDRYRQQPSRPAPHAPPKKPAVPVPSAPPPYRPPVEQTSPKVPAKAPVKPPVKPQVAMKPGGNSPAMKPGGNSPATAPAVAFKPGRSPPTAAKTTPRPLPPIKPSAPPLDSAPKKLAMMPPKPSSKPAVSRRPPG